jgi:hypothetical protein
MPETRGHGVELHLLRRLDYTDCYREFPQRHRVRPEMMLDYVRLYVATSPAGSSSRVTYPSSVSHPGAG